MKQYLIGRGTRAVVVTVEGRQVSARLYVGNAPIPEDEQKAGWLLSQTAVGTLVCWRGKTEAGARKWAEKTLAS